MLTVWDSTLGLAVDKGTRLEEEMDDGNDSDCAEGPGMKTTPHTEMLGPAFKTRTDVWPSMRMLLCLLTAG